MDEYNTYLLTIEVIFHDGIIQSVLFSSHGEEKHLCC